MHVISIFHPCNNESLRLLQLIRLAILHCVNKTIVNLNTISKLKVTCLRTYLAQDPIGSTITTLIK